MSPSLSLSLYIYIYICITKFQTPASRLWLASAAPRLPSAACHRGAAGGDGWALGGLVSSTSLPSSLPPSLPLLPLFVSLSPSPSPLRCLSLSLSLSLSLDSPASSCLCAIVHAICLLSPFQSPRHSVPLLLLLSLSLTLCLSLSLSLSFFHPLPLPLPSTQARFFLSHGRW